MVRRTAVLGGGAMGLTIAYRLAKAGDEVTLIEREPEPGGLAAGFKMGDVYLEKFYHHLFRSDSSVIALIGELGLDNKLVWPRPITSTLINGEILQMDSPASLLMYRALPLIDRLRMGLVVAYLKYVVKDEKPLEGKTADVWLRKWMGVKGYQLQWEPLLKNKFHHFYKAIALPWFWSRVHLRSAELGYVKGGFQQLYNRLAEEITTAGGSLRFGESVTSIEEDAAGHMHITTDKEKLDFDRVVSTLPTRLTIALTKGLPDSYRERYAWGDALGAHCLILELNQEFFGDWAKHTYWLNINDTGYPFLAVVEHTNYMPESDYDGRHLLYVGNYAPMDSPLLSRSKEEIIEDFIPHLTKINPAFNSTWITGSHSFSAPYAQPIVTTEFRMHIPPHDTPLENLYLANMFQVYPQDRGQNYSIKMAEVVARMLGG